MLLRAIALLVVLLIFVPLVSLAVVAFRGETEGLTHIIRFVLPNAFWTTLWVMLGVSLLAGSMGTVCAWLVTYYQFFGRGLLVWALALPLAVPTYLAAYTMTEFMSFTGPVQTLLRTILGVSSPTQYWFPEIRSLPGAILVLSLVLYPYVYLSTFALFKLQGRRFMDAARLLNAGPITVFFRVVLPLARPAVIAGISLCLMEALNDIGAVEYLGVETLTFAVFTTWINRYDVVSAAQLTLAIFLVVAFLFVLERLAHRHQKMFAAHAGTATERATRETLKGWQQALAFVACAMPVALGFGMPLLVLASYLKPRSYLFFEPTLYQAAWASTWLSALSAVLCGLLALLLTYAVRSSQQTVGSMKAKYGKLDSWLATVLVRVGTLGYAIPGTILALGLFLPFAALDNWLHVQMRDWFSITTGLIFSGSGVLIVYAYVVRFLAIAEGNLSAGFSKLTPSLDQAARLLGHGPLSLLARVHLPILAPALLVAMLLVFIDAMKELSATLFLRPFGLNTLATHLYEFASQSKVEEGAAAALIVMVLGIIPVIFVTRASFTNKA